MSSLNLFNSPDECIHYKPLDGKFDYYPHFFSIEESDIYLKYLLNNILWKQDYIKMYGKEHPIPRLTSWFGDEGKGYTYSGIEMKPNNWTKELLSIKSKIEEKVEITFNSLLLNLYKDGNDSVAWHADDEKELGEDVIIASVSFGEKRDFQLKHKIDTSVEKINIPLEHGSLLLMFPPTQENWLHQLPRRKKVNKPRINLTFRKII